MSDSDILKGTSPVGFVFGDTLGLMPTPEAETFGLGDFAEICCDVEVFFREDELVGSESEHRAPGSTGE